MSFYRFHMIFLCLPGVTPLKNNAEPRPQEAFDQGKDALPVPRVTQVAAVRGGPGRSRVKINQNGE